MAQDDLGLVRRSRHLTRFLAKGVFRGFATGRAPYFQSGTHKSYHGIDVKPNHDDSLITFARAALILQDGASAGVLRPNTTIVLGKAESVIGQCRQPRRVPLLAASDALPFAAGLDRCGGERRRSVARRTGVLAKSGDFFVGQLERVSACAGFGGRGWVMPSCSHVEARQSVRH